MSHALLFDGPGQPLRAVSPPKPRLNHGEAWVKVECCALCRSDLHTYMGRRNEPTPTILGHEIIGRVEESRCRVQPGSRVTWGIAASCGECFFCRKGIPQKCVSLFKYGHTESELRGPYSGGLATHVLLRAGTPIVELPDALPDEVAVLANCSTATAAAVVRAASLQPGEVVVVLGAGVLGLTASAMLAEKGCRVVSFDPSPGAAARAPAFGAVQSCTQWDELGEALGLATEGRGADACLELSGALAAAQASLGLVRIGGRVVWAGTTSPLGEARVAPEFVVRQLLTLRGVHNYAPEDLEEAVAFLERSRDRLPFGELVAGVFSLDQAEEAFQAAEACPGQRVLVRP